MYGSIFIQFCAVASKRRIFSAPKCFVAVQGHSGSSKVDDFSTNRKRVCDFLLVGHCNYGPILHRFWDKAIYWLKIGYFFYPTLNCEFRAEVNRQNNRLTGLILQWRPHDRIAWVVLTQCQRVTDRQTDRRTDGFTVASTAALCIASYADAL